MTIFKSRFPIFPAAVLTFGFVCALAAPARADVMSDIVANVKANEALYTNIEVVKHDTFKHEGTSWDPVGPVVDASEDNLRYVLQGPLIYVQRNATSHIKDEIQRDNTLQGYDGEITRTIGDGVANIHFGRYEDCHIYGPHTWLFSGRFFCGPLSLWLKGGKEMQNYERAGIYRNYDHKVSFEKEEVVDGLSCVKIRAEGWTGADKKAKLEYMFLVWLAPDRNYLPVKSESFSIRWSKELPADVARAKDFREIGPGIWLPFAKDVIAYDYVQLPEKKLQVRNKESYAVTEAKLDPKYDIALFRDIEIPEGTAVYELKDGKITNSYVQGQAKPQPPRSKRAVWGWFIVANIVACALFAALLVGFRAYKMKNAKQRPVNPETGA